mmetsp:Transcript_155/g.262  ORF Transcript_155/g.262 Transcript_155/m.262 type:complete len:152 (+) Transcript_155:193-648(+)
MKSSRKIEPLRLSSKMKQELSTSGVFTAAGANAILQKLVVEAESAEADTSRKSDFSASFNSINILDDDEEEQATPTTEKSVMGKLNASFSNFFRSSIEGLRDELDSSTSNLAERNSDKERNIAPKRSSLTFHKERTIMTDKQSHRCGEVKW